MNSHKRSIKLDWWTILLYVLLVFIGWLNIYSASLSDTSQGFFDFSQIYFKQFFFILTSVLLILFVLAIDSKFYERFSSIIYLVSIASLLGLFLFGKNVNGATSWYAIGSFSIQPSEFAKAATALALGKYVSDIQTNMKELKHQFRTFLILAIPAILIIPQPDPGSALVYAAFIFPLYREGLNYIFILIGFFAALLFIGTLLIGVQWVILIIVVSVLLRIFFKRKRKRIKWTENPLVLP